MNIDKPLIDRVEEAILTVKPYLEADGGDIRIVEITEDNQVVVELLGACETCPMSAMTMKAGIEQAVKNKVPEITGIISLNKVQESSI
jgi:Fe-S cluster biogenesis protein NfuA